MISGSGRASSVESSKLIAVHRFVDPLRLSIAHRRNLMGSVPDVIILHAVYSPITYFPYSFSSLCPYVN